MISSEEFEYLKFMIEENVMNAQHIQQIHAVLTAAAVNQMSLDELVEKTGLSKKDIHKATKGGEFGKVSDGTFTMNEQPVEQSAESGTIEQPIEVVDEATSVLAEMGFHEVVTQQDESVLADTTEVVDDVIEPIDDQITEQASDIPVDDEQLDANAGETVVLDEESVGELNELIGTDITTDDLDNIDTNEQLDAGADGDQDLIDDLEPVILICADNATGVPSKFYDEDGNEVKTKMVTAEEMATIKSGNIINTNVSQVPATEFPTFNTRPGSKAWSAYQLLGANPSLDRKSKIALLVEHVGLTPDGASTYIYNYGVQVKQAAEKAVKEQTEQTTH